jgi:hypothetical protein
MRRERSMRQKLVLWFLLLLAGFLIGFILQYSRLNQVQQKLSASTTQLGAVQSTIRTASRAIYGNNITTRALLSGRVPVPAAAEPFLAEVRGARAEARVNKE